MGTELLVTLVVVLAVSLSGTGLVRRFALRRGLMDVPNARSSHTTPVPRGGGVAIVLAAVLGWCALHFLGLLDAGLFRALLGGGLAIALLGYLDDLRGLSSRVRLTIHFAAAIWAVWCLGAYVPAWTGNGLIDLWMGRVLSVFAIVWTLNLFNFMDGIDGLAGSEATFVALSGAALSMLAGAGADIVSAPLVLAAASAGFLWWNWPPARIFMGDVGSGFLGYVIVLMALGASGQATSAFPAWLILGGVFLVDATVTLMRRVLRHERFDEAHRSHAYQWQARRWGGHRPVTLAVVLINVAVLLPSAWLVVARPRWSLVVTLIVFAILLLLALRAGAGRREN